MIDLYTFNTSNGQRAAIILEECGLPYRVHKVDLTKGEQKAPGFLNINPAGAIPAIIDHDGPGGVPLRLAQSGAIVLYAATKAGKFLPDGPGPAGRGVAMADALGHRRRPREHVDLPLLDDRARQVRREHRVF